MIFYIIVLVCFSIVINMKYMWKFHILWTDFVGGLFILVLEMIELILMDKTQ